MAHLATSLGFGLNLNIADFGPAFDTALPDRVLLLDDPGSVGGHALADTITIATAAGGVSYRLIYNFSGLVLDANHIPVAGQLTSGFLEMFDTATGVSAGLGRVTGLHLDAVDLYAAAVTPGTIDDRALWQHQFASADRLSASAFNDTIYGYGGDDTILGNAGADQLRGGEGADRIHGGLDGDTLRGGNGNDALFGGGGDDMLFGGHHGTGPDTLRGGAGADLFVFNAVSGNDLVMDFHHGVDKLVFAGGAASFADLDIVIGDASTLVFFGGGMIRLDWFNGHHLDAGDCVFM